MPEFAGSDGKLYNAAWGPVHITDGGKNVWVGGLCIANADELKLIYVPTPSMPSFQPRYFSADQRILRIYDATKT